MTKKLLRFDPRRISESNLCSGCGACAHIAPDNVRMKLDEKGYLRPVVEGDLDAQQLVTIGKICPGVGLEQAKDSDIPYDVTWGPILSLSAGYAKDTAIRREGSSGGVLSALLVHLLESGKVAYVVHTRVSRTDPLGNETVISRSRAEVLSGAGSRYAPASPVAALSTALKMKGNFAFVGKPCDVSAVRQLQKIDVELAKRIPYLLSFMCAGTPSRHGTVEVIARMGLSEASITVFRYRGNGWPGMTVADTADGRRGEMNYNTSWGTILNRHLQTRCKLCADGTGEFADIVGADAWYGKDGYPDFTEREGRSLVVARTLNGRTLLAEAVLSGAIVLEPFEKNDLSSIQPYQLKRKQSILSRSIAMFLFGKSTPRYVRMGLFRAAWDGGGRLFLRELLGSCIRILKNRI